MNDTLDAYAERTLPEVNSSGKLAEWIEELPVPQSEISEYALDLEEFCLAASFCENHKNQAWEQLISSVAQVIWIRSRVDGIEIVWRIRPEFSVYSKKVIFASQPDWFIDLKKEMAARPTHKAAIVCYFRCAFRNGEQS